MFSSYLRVVYILSALALPIVKGQECAPYASSCTNAPIIAAYPPDDLDCVVDSSDSASIAIEYYACPCSSGALATGTLIYEGYDQGMTTVTALAAQTLTPSVYQLATLSFPVAYTTVGGFFVTLIEEVVDGSSTGIHTATYGQLQEQTVVYTDTTTTFTSTSIATASKSWTVDTVSLLANN
jgi:hypothetical protein